MRIWQDVILHLCTTAADSASVLGFLLLLLLLLSRSSLQHVLWCQSIVWFLQVWLLSSTTWQQTRRVLCWTCSSSSLPPSFAPLIPGLSTHDTCHGGAAEGIWHFILTCGCDLASSLTLTLSVYTHSRPAVCPQPIGRLRSPQSNSTNVKEGGIQLDR